MRRKRWLAPWKDEHERPVLYHVVSRVVDRRFAMGERERGRFLCLMRAYEGFSGCRVLSFCVMSNHFHLLLEVPPMAEGGINEEDFFRRLACLYPESFVKAVREDVERYRREGREGDGRSAGGKGGEKRRMLRAEEQVRELREAFEYRMHDLSEFMKGLLQRFTQWYNGQNDRSGTLWESRFNSVIVEDGVAARTMAAYIDLNPVRAGMVIDPGDYKWSSYGEAMQSRDRRVRRQARRGLMRAWTCHGRACDVEKNEWSGERGLGGVYRRVLLEGVFAPGRNRAEDEVKGQKLFAELQELREGENQESVRMGVAAAYRTRYFTKGGVLGGRHFVDEVFEKCRERFGASRTSGARKPRGALAALAGVLWSARDLGPAPG